MWEVEPMNPTEAVLEHLGMTGEEYREKCRADLRREILQELGIFESACRVPTTLQRDAMVRRALTKYQSENPYAKLVILVEFTDPNKPPLPFEEVFALGRIAPETPSTDEEEIVWPI